MLSKLGSVEKPLLGCRRAPTSSRILRPKDSLASRGDTRVSLRTGTETPPQRAQPAAVSAGNTGQEGLRGPRRPASPLLGQHQNRGGEVSPKQTSKSQQVPTGQIGGSKGQRTERFGILWGLGKLPGWAGTDRPLSRTSSAPQKGPNRRGWGRRALLNS